MKKVKLLICLLLMNNFICSAQVTNLKGVEINSKSKDTIGNTYALVIGISKYKHVPSLKYADRDAEIFANYLTSKNGFGLDTSNVQLLLNESANLDNFGNAASDLIFNKGLKKGDKVIFFFSGHGDYEAKVMKNQALLLLYAAPKSNYFQNLFKGDFISTSDLNTKFIEPLVNMGCEIILIIDACHATGLNAELSGGISGGKITALALESLPSPVKLFSCKSDQLSLEGEQYGGGRGLFSYVLMEGLYGLADADTNKTITLRELQRYLEDIIPKMALPNKQDPIVKADNALQVFAKVDEVVLEEYKINKNYSLPFLSKATIRSGNMFSGINMNDLQKKAYKKFNSNIKENNLSGAYEVFIDYIKLDSLSNFSLAMRRSLSASLQVKAADLITPVIDDISKMRYALPDIILARQELERAKDLLTENHYLYHNLKARIIFFKALELKVYSNSSDSVRKAISFLKEAIVLEPNASYCYFILGNLYYTLKYFEESRKNYQTYLDLVPKSYQAYNNIGMINYELKNYIEAISDFRQALKLNSNANLSLSNLGLVNIALSKYADAENYLIQALEINPALANAHYNLGLVYYKQNRYDKASKEYKLAIELNNNFKAAYQNMGILNYKMNNYSDALDAFQNAFNLDSEDDLTLYYLGKLFFHYANYKMAESNFKLAYKLNPKNSDALFELGSIYFINGDLKEAKKVYRNYIAIYPSEPKGYNVLADIYYTYEKKYDSSAYYFKKANVVTKGNPVSYEKYAYSLLFTHKTKAAINVFKQSLLLKPGQEWGYYNLSAAYASLGNHKEALTYLQSAIEHNINILSKVESDPLFNNLRAKNSFKKLFEKYYSKLELVKYPNLFMNVK